MLLTDENADDTTLEKLWDNLVDKKWVMTNRQVYQILYRYVFPAAKSKFAADAIYEMRRQNYI